MTSQRPTRTTVSEHLAGSKHSWHSTISKDGPFKPEANRYHLYIGLFCPFAHRVNLVRHLKGLQDVRQSPASSADSIPSRICLLRMLL